MFETKQASFWEQQYKIFSIVLAVQKESILFLKLSRFLWGQDFNFYYMFETNFSEHNKIWEAQKNWGGTAPNAPRGYGPETWYYTKLNLCRKRFQQNLKRLRIKMLNLPALKSVLGRLSQIAVKLVIAKQPLLMFQFTDWTLRVGWEKHFSWNAMKHFKCMDCHNRDNTLMRNIVFITLVVQRIPVGLWWRNSLRLTHSKLHSTSKMLPYTWR